MAPNLKRVLHKLRFSLFYFTRTSKSYAAKKNQPYAIIHLDDKFLRYAYGRHVYILCKYFEYAGFTVVLKTDYGYITSPVKYKTALLKEKVHFVRSCDTLPNTIQLHTTNGVTKQIKMVYGDMSKQAYDCLAPYPMHPHQYSSPAISQYKALRTPERPLKIFFAGNVEEKFYNSTGLEQTFKVISRHKVITHIKNRFGPAGNIRLVSDKAALDALTSTKKSEPAVIISAARINPDEWLKVLSQAAFFIAPPGIQLPWSHNAVEALAVGTIPILQYGALFDPALVHLENCLAYQNLTELEQVIETALTMEAEQIRRMQTNAAAYFDKYLSAESVLQRIQQFLDSEKQQVTVGFPFVRPK